MPSRPGPARRLWLPALCGVLIVVALLAWGIPWLTKSRADTTATPTPPPFAAVAPITLKGGSVACENAVALATQTRAATILTAKFVGAGPRLRVVASAPGYEGVGTIAAGYRGEQALRVELPAPPRDAIGTICVENTGRRAIVLQGTTEGRIQNRSATSIDDKVIPAKMALILTEQTNRSLADRPGEILDRIAAFKPFYVGPVSLLLLGLLVLVGVPAGVLYAIARGIADED
jgi:hypothetical protein